MADDAIRCVLTVVLKRDVRLKAIAPRWNIEWDLLGECARGTINLWRF